MSPKRTKKQTVFIAVRTLAWLIVTALILLSIG
jgi:hypothetical protein